MRCTLSTFFRLGTVPRVSGESAPVFGIAGGVALALTVLLIGFIVFTPFAWASTYEAWMDGLYDAELQNDLLALSTLQLVINGAVLTSSGRVDVVVAVLSPGDDRVADLADLSPRSARAPPTA